MTAHEQLIAYLATLGTLCFVFGTALFAAGHQVTVNEAFGLGTITGGLIGVLRIPSLRSNPDTPQQVQVMNDDKNAVPVEPAA